MQNRIESRSRMKAGVERKLDFNQREGEMLIDF